MALTSGCMLRKVLIMPMSRATLRSEWGVAASGTPRLSRRVSVIVFWRSPSNRVLGWATVRLPLPIAGRTQSARAAPGAPRLLRSSRLPTQCA